MAKPKAKRVFQLAKQLGVGSKDIIAKCAAEGIELNNHMATISVGLEASIREWFSESEEGSHTAIEEAEHPDVKKLRKKAKRRIIVTPEPEPEPEPEPVSAPEPEPEPEVMVDEVPAAPVEDPVAEEPVTEEIEEVPEPVSEAESTEAVEAAVEEASVETEEPVEEAVVAEDTTASDEDQAPQAETDDTPDEPVADSPAPDDEKKDPKPGKKSPGVQMNNPERPNVTPAGPQLTKPAALKLKGPKIVRVERPDEVQKPRRRDDRRGGGGGGGPRGPRGGGGGDMPMPSEPELIRSRGPARGRGAGGPSTDDDHNRSPRRNKRGGGGGGQQQQGNAGNNRGRSASSDRGWKKQWSAQDLIEREERLNRSGGFLKSRRRDLKRREQGQQALTPAQVGGKVEIEEPITIKGLSSVTGIKGADIVSYLFKKGIMANINAAIDTESAMEIALEYEIELEVKEAKTAEEVMESLIDQREKTDERRRPPIVTVLGHVDHGKTSLLDRIRQASVAPGEDGGITQHIGAYKASMGEGDAKKEVVFLDTPGHEAFTEMRARGANMTDVVVLVVAADDGCMPQTIESIAHAKAAGVPIVVALNKIDIPQATEENIQKILGQLAEHGLNPADWGGDTEVMRVSAETGEGIEDLIEVLDYQAELLELSACYSGSAHGRIIEGELQRGRGPVARLLVLEGHVSVGDFLVAGRAFGRVRDMLDDRGNRIESAGPATPVEISGLDEVSDAGDRWFVTESLKKAEEIATQRREKDRQDELVDAAKISLTDMFEKVGEDVKELRLVVKADVQGSVEVLKKTLEKVEEDNPDVRVRVLHAAVGGITESDVLLAEASDAVIVGFHVIASAKARTEGEHRKVQIRLYRVIYDIVDDVKNALEGMLSPIEREQVLGHAEVRQVFRISKVGSVAGCYVTDGEVRRNALIRVTRNDIVIEHDRSLEQLKRFKDDAREVRSNMECGMKIVGYDDIHEGDILECYVKVEEKATL